MDFNGHYKVRLAPANVNTTIDDAKKAVVFDVTPELSEARNVMYKMYDPVHAPGQILVYQGTQARRFQLTQIKLVSRSPQEASINLGKLWIMRSWTLPVFGQTSENPRLDRAREEQLRSTGPYSNDRIRQLVDDIGLENSRSYLGAPPPVLLLSAYSRLGVGSSVGTNSIGHLKKVPVVIESLNINYPTDVDYIPTEGSDPTPMPTIMTVDISLVESHSPSEYEGFNLQKFRRGELEGF